MQVTPISFGHKHIMKKLWKKNKLPTVKRGLYGDLLTKDNLSLEHGNPVSLGGKTITDNLFLASKEKNHARGNRPITEFLTKEMAEAYFEQFKDVVVKIGKQIVFVGNDYIQRATKTLKSLGVNLN